MKKISLLAFMALLVPFLLISPVDAATPLNNGDLIRKSGSSQIYFIDQSGKMRLFPETKVLTSWYNAPIGRLSIKTIKLAEFSALSTSSNMTVRPGRLLKFNSEKKIYAVLPANRLCPISNMAALAALYGKNWSNRLLSVKLAEKSDYLIDENCAINADSKLPDGSLIQYRDSSDVYYINGGKKAKLLNNDFSALGFSKRMIITNVDPSMSYEDAGWDSKIMSDFVAEAVNVRTITIDDCRQELNRDKIDKCLSALAERTQSLNVCPSISNADLKATCYQYIAGQKKNISICSYIRNTNTRGDCITTVALALSNKNYCNRISNKDQKSVCLGYFSVRAVPTVQSCGLEKDSEMRMLCFENLVVKNNDASICEQLADQHERDLCYYNVPDRLAQATINPDYDSYLLLCKKIIAQDFKDRCIMNLGYRSNRPDFCDLIQDEAMKLQCHR